MKKAISLASLSIGLLISTSASAQDVKFGIKGGLNVTDMRLSTDLFSETNRMGGFIGPTVKFTLPIVGLGVDVSALYDFREAKLKDPSKQEKAANSNSSKLPLFYRFRLYGQCFSFCWSTMGNKYR